jgi:hypothetical protein
MDWMHRKVEQLDWIEQGYAAPLFNLPSGKGRDETGRQVDRQKQYYQAARARLKARKKPTKCAF